MKKEKISKELARVHAHLCGDGYSSMWKTEEKDRNFTAVTGYCNNNKKLLKKFREDFSKIFEVKMKMREKEVSIRSIKIFKELKSKFGSFGSRRWKIPLNIKDSSNDIKLEWLKAFFYDEGYQEERYNRMKIKSVNLGGLKDVKNLIDSLKIECSITGPNVDGSYYLTIPDFDNVKMFENFSKKKVRSNLKI